MAVAFVRQSTFTAGSFLTTQTVTLSGTPAAGNTLIYTDYRTVSTATIVSISGCGATWTKVDRAQPASGGNASQEMWIGVGCSGSGSSLSVTFDTNRAMVANVQEYSGLDGTFGTPAKDAQTTGTAVNSGTVTPVTSGDLVVSIMGDGNSGTITASDTPAAFTTLTQVSTGAYRNASSYRISTSTSAHARTWTKGTSGHWTSISAAFPAASSTVTAAVAATLPALTSSVAATSTVTAAVGATLPSLTASADGLTTIPAAVAANLPSLTAAVTATSTVTGDIGATLPSLTASVDAVADDTVLGEIAANLPSLTASAAAVVTVTGEIGATLPSLTAAVDVTVTAPAADSITATLPALSATVEALNFGESVATLFDSVTVQDLLYVGLSPDTDIDVAVPILRESHPSPVLTQANPTPQMWVDYDPITEPVGFPHIWVDDVDISYFRGSPTIVRNWTREMPWGDKTAAWEMPQLHPWDTPGEGDLTFLRKGARVVIGIVDLDGNIDEKWSGRYHARTKGLDVAHDWVFEAKGAMWAAMNQILEPVPYQPPIDVGRLVPRLLNKLIGRSFNAIPETVTGIPTRYRGARDEYVWQAVQNILAKAWTDDGRQWALVQVARDEFRLQLKKPMSEVTATVAYGNPGVDFEVSVDEDSAVDHVFCRWVNPGGGESANVFYPGLELLNGLPYPNADAGEFLNLGTTDGDTTSGTGVTDWQTKVRSLGYTTLAVTGVMSSAWVAVVEDVQEALDLTVDGSVGPQTWTASFTAVLEDVDLTPRRLPMAKKPETWPWRDGANGAILGDNPDFDGNEPIQVPLDMGTNITRAEVAKAARTYLAVNGTAVASGSVRFRGCPDDMARTDLTVGDNLEIRGHEGTDIVVQLSRMSVDVVASDVSSVYAVTFDVDERARDALTIDQILERNRDALPDPARRPGLTNRSSRNVRDEGFSWDADSPCGKLTRTAVNGDTGLWTRRVIPFAEIGQLAGIRLHSTVPFAMMLMSSLRFTENMALSVVGNPFDSTDPYRPVWNQLKEFGILGAWGAQDDACGFSPGTEGSVNPDTGLNYAFTGDFIEGTTLEYVTEGPTAPYVAVLLFARGDSGFVWGDDYGDGFLPARQT